MAHFMQESIRCLVLLAFNCTAQILVCSLVVSRSHIGLVTNPARASSIQSTSPEACSMPGTIDMLKQLSAPDTACRSFPQQIRYPCSCSLPGPGIGIDQICRDVHMNSFTRKAHLSWRHESSPRHCEAWTSLAEGSSY